MTSPKVLMMLGLFVALQAQAEQSFTGAFSEGKNLGSANTQGTFSGISTDKAKKVIPAYGQSTPESNYFQGGSGNTTGYGVAKIQSCETTGPTGTPVQRQECEAVNFLAKNPDVRPQMNISKNDGIIQKTRAIQGSAEDIFGPIGGSTTQCVTKTETVPAEFDTNTCVNLTEAESQQCTMGRIVDINADSNFQCKQTINAYETYSCNKQVSVSVTAGSSTTTTQTVCDEGNYVAYGKNGKPGCDTGCYTGWARCVDGNCLPFCLELAYQTESGSYATVCNEAYVYEGGVGRSWPMAEISAGMDKSMSCGRYYTTGLNGLVLTKYGVRKTVTVQNPPVITTTVNNGCAALETRAQ